MIFSILHRGDTTHADSLKIRQRGKDDVSLCVWQRFIAASHSLSRCPCFIIELSDGDHASRVFMVSGCFSGKGSRSDVPVYVREEHRSARWRQTENGQKERLIFYHELRFCLWYDKAKSQQTQGWIRLLTNENGNDRKKRWKERL